MKRQDYLKRICTAKYGEGTHSSPALASLYSGQLQEVKRVYEEMGGLLSDVPFRFKEYDIPLKDFIIELDEQEHFNRYRLKTLESSIYEDCKNFNVEAYKKSCGRYESRCRDYGKFWETNSTKKQFGPAKHEYFPEDTGGSRWKQRALYDMIKDAYSLATKLPIIRISIYDIYKDTPIDDLLSDRKKDTLLAYVDMRLQKALEK